MSIEKDVEKKYRDELERQTKKLKKKKKRRLLLLLLLLLLLGSVGLLMGLFGLFPGMGDDSGDGGSSKASSSSASSSAVETTTTAAPTVYDDVKVSGSTYIYQGQVKTLEEIKTIVSNMKENVTIRIIDDNATKNAMDNLVNMLTDSGRQIERVDPGINNSSSSADSSSSSSSSEGSSSESESSKD